MKRKELIIVNSFILLMVVLFGLLTVRLSINEGLPAVVANALSHDVKGAAVNTDTAGTCSIQKPLALTNASADPHVKQLQRYQDLCGSYVTNTLMVFTGFPASGATASSGASVIAKKLQTLHQAGIKPIVVAEPYAGDTAMSYRDFLDGKYDMALSVYFAALKNQGITDDMMGTWVPFPESNTPNWNNKDTEPRDYALCVNKYLTAMKKQFPDAKGSILLSAVTYQPDDTEWDNGDYLALTPYLQDINKDLVSSMGIQGFPWVSNAKTTRREIFRATEFLQPDFAIAAAQELHTRDIWFNTGSFASKYTNDKMLQVDLMPNERQSILQGILEVAGYVRRYQQNEYRVSVNLFSEDKSKANEATDWSYWRSEDDQRVLRDFLVKAAKQDTPVSLFDMAQ
jgi:hypothetical protein